MVKTAIKRFIFFIAFILTLPLIILTWIEVLFFGKQSERIYGFCKELLAVIPTLIGAYLRLAYYKSVCSHIGFDVQMLTGSMIAHRDTVIRKGTIIGTYTIIGYADIGENVIFGARISVLSGKYQHGRPGERGDEEEAKEEYTRIFIGANSWIGEGSIILANIGANCTIGAGSVLLKDAPDDSTFMGNPARKVNIK
jgi:acetyltransferase-like isoleucine patch superfamily enzyme